MSEYLQPSVLGVATATLSVVRAVAKKVTYSRTEGRKKMQVCGGGWEGAASVAKVRWLGLRARATWDSVAGRDLGGRVGCEQGLGNLIAKMW